MTVAVSLIVLTLCSLALSLVCESFDGASNYLGRRLPPGIKGATINAIGSSMPELLTASIFLFVYDDVAGFAAGVATCAGSAVFNAVIIPALCIGAAVLVGVGPKGARRRVPFIQVARHTVLRDGLFFVGSTLVMILVLSQDVVRWWMGLALASFYGLYVAWLVREVRAHAVSDEDEEDEEDAEGDTAAKKSLLWGFVTLDVNRVIFGGRSLSSRRAWVVLGVSLVIMAAVCEELVNAVVDIAVALEVPPYFAAVILAAAATSVPDTILSVRDSLAGAYDDAVANAFGSNIFDITIALGLPVALYGLTRGDIELAAAGGTDVRDLQIALLLVTGVTLASLLQGGGRAGKGKAILLGLVYVAWTVFVLWRAGG